jgi:uncharacterized membrane-anchored protein
MFAGIFEEYEDNMYFFLVPVVLILAFFFSPCSFNPMFAVLVLVVLVLVVLILAFFFFSSLNLKQI